MEYITSQTPIRGSVIQENTFLTNDAIAQTPYKGANYSTILSSANGGTIQTPYIGVYYGPTVDLADGTMLLSPATTVPGHSGNTISVEIEIKDNGTTTISSRAYPVTADNIERPGEVIEYTVDGKTAYYPTPQDPEVPAGYIRCEFLEGTGTQYIDTGCTFDNNTGIACTFIYTNSRLNMNVIAGRDSGANNRLYSPYFGLEGSWSIGYGQYIVTGIRNPDPFSTICSTSINFRNDKKYLVQDTELYSLDADSNFSCSYTLVIFGASVSGTVFNHLIGRVFEAQISQGSEIVRNYIPAITPAGVPCMYDKVTKQPLYNEGEGSFIVGMTAEQARLLGELPEGGGTLTISLPSDVVDENGMLQDMAIITAISTAMAKGWTFILQTHDGATVEIPLPPGYMECEFLEATGTQYINTEVIEGAIWTHDIQFTKTNSRQLMGYRGDMAGYWGACEQNYPEIGKTDWITQINSTERHIYNFTVASRLTTLECEGYSISRTQTFVAASVYPYRLLALSYQETFPCWAKVYSVQANKTEGTIRDYVPAISPNGTPCMYDKVTKQPFYNEGTGAFIVGMTAAQALNLAKLPAGGGELTVSLPDTIVSADGDVWNEEVATAIETATDNGWTITVQSYVADDLSDVGGDDYIRANFLESTGTQWINTGIIPANKKIGFIGKARYDASTINMTASGLFGSYAIDSGDPVSIGVYQRKWRPKINTWNVYGTELDSLPHVFYVNMPNGSGVGTEVLSTAAPAAILSTNNCACALFAITIPGSHQVYGTKRLYWGQIYDDPTLLQSHIPAISPDGTPCMYDGVTKKPFYNGGTGAFVVGLTASQALNLADLPEKTASLTISLPASIVSGSTITDAQVASAIETARSKGWTITVQTYTE